MDKNLKKIREKALELLIEVKRGGHMYAIIIQILKALGKIDPSLRLLKIDFDKHDDQAQVIKVDPTPTQQKDLVESEEPKTRGRKPSKREDA